MWYDIPEHKPYSTKVAAWLRRKSIIVLFQLIKFYDTTFYDPAFYDPCAKYACIEILFAILLPLKFFSTFDLRFGFSLT